MPTLRVSIFVCIVTSLVACGDALPRDASVDAVMDSEVQSPDVVLVPVEAERTEKAPSPQELAAQKQAKLAEKREKEQAALEAKYPMSGTVFHFLARVYRKPTHKSSVVGYMRRGAMFRASRRVSVANCKKGWYEVPGEGFVCRGEGFLIGKTVERFQPSPTPPAMQDALPYVYAYAPRDGSAQYWRLPSEEEEVTAKKAIREVRNERQKKRDTVPSKQEPPDKEVTPEENDQEVIMGAEAPPPPGAPESPLETEPIAVRLAVEALGDAVEGAPVEVEALVPSLPDYVRLEMQRGFYISIDREEKMGDRRFYRTIRGTYVRTDKVSANEPPSHRGVVLGGDWQLPIAFVYRSGTQRLRRVAETGRMRTDGTLVRHTPLIVRDQLSRSKGDYIVSSDAAVVSRKSVRIAKKVSRPIEVSHGDRWIHVDLSEQVLVAYIGDMPVFATAVSTGKKEHETPTGVFRIASKHVSTTMDDLTSDEGQYMIDDVPWTMYFEGNYALHGAFWHTSFGRPRSHGCVNLAPADARWLFYWTGPSLPHSWHGIFATRDNPGTQVYITE